MVVPDSILLYGGPYHGRTVNDPGVDNVLLGESRYRRHYFIDPAGISVTSLVEIGTEPIIDDFNELFTTTALRIAFGVMGWNRDNAKIQR